MCDECNWETAVADCNDMLIDPDYDFAEDTIEGIRDWVKENEHVTDRQRTALENIRESVEG